MSTFVKIVIGAAALLLVLCAGGAILTAGSIGALTAFIGNTFQGDAGRVDAAAAKIADFTLPSGYRPEATAEIAGYVFVSYAPGDGHSHIQFVQGPADGPFDQSTLEGYLQRAAGNSDKKTSSRSHMVDSIQATIRGQAVTLVVGEAINHDGETFRSVSGVFSGKGGPAFVSVESPVSSWNRQVVDAFIASIR